MVARPCRRRRPSSLDDGGISGLFSSGGPSVRFLTRYDGEVSIKHMSGTVLRDLHVTHENFTMNLDRSGCTYFTDEITEAQRG